MWIFLHSCEIKPGSALEATPEVQHQSGRETIHDLYVLMHGHMSMRQNILPTCPLH